MFILRKQLIFVLQMYRNTNYTERIAISAVWENIKIISTPIFITQFLPLLLCVM